MRNWIMAGLLALPTAPSAEVAALDVHACSQLEQPQERLACFDALKPVVPPEAGDTTEVTVKDTGFTLVYAPPGSFNMGSPPDELYRDADETQHTVILSEGFYIGETPVTQKLYQAVMRRKPSDHYACTECPVENITWADAVKFCNRLSELEGLEPAYTIQFRKITFHPDAPGYRLLTEAEWEYAARAGEYQRYAGSDTVGEVAWTDANSGHDTQPVATKQPNAWGLYDMSGNVFEWTGDWYARDLTDATRDPAGPPTGGMRVFRGGCVEFSSVGARVANRSMHYPYFKNGALGFRVARDE